MSKVKILGNLLRIGFQHIKPYWVAYTPVLASAVLVQDPLRRLVENDDLAIGLSGGVGMLGSLVLVHLLAHRPDQRSSQTPYQQTLVVLYWVIACCVAASHLLLGGSLRLVVLSFSLTTIMLLIALCGYVVLFGLVQIEQLLPPNPPKSKR